MRFLPVPLHRNKLSTFSKTFNELKPRYDAVIVGGGHNGLIAATYLQKKGLNVCVLERRHVLGGAAVTEEIVKGFKFSRASYLLSLLRPQIIEELELEKHGLKLYPRDPSSYTPLREKYWGNGPKSLTLSSDSKFNKDQIGRFSQKDAVAFENYEDWLFKFISAIEQLMDNSPPQFSEKSPLKLYKSLKPAIQFAKSIGRDVGEFYDLMASPASKILNTWFESDVLKATLATDSVIGAMMSPETPGSAYVLLHHMMGGVNGQRGTWAYVEGGMGGVTKALASVARASGVDMVTEAAVKEILIENRRVKGVELTSGQVVEAGLVLSNATPQVTFLDLIPQGKLPLEFESLIKNVDYESATTKINVALDRLPDFKADPNISLDPMPHHRCTIHMNCEDMNMIHEAYLDAAHGRVSKKPMIEMVLPSSLDPTLAPPGKHVALFFTQYTPYNLADGEKWTNEKRTEYAQCVFNTVEDYAPGFKESILGYEVLTPVDLESIFGLTGGNIFHGSMRLDQLFMTRPTKHGGFPATPIGGLFLCGSGAHPGGGVMGSPGKIAAFEALKSIKRA